MEENEKKEKPLSLVEKMRLKSKTTTVYGGEYKEKKAELGATDCPNCGAGRAKRDGVKKCAYCGFEFIQHDHTQGIHLTKEKDRNEL